MAGGRGAAHREAAPQLHRAGDQLRALGHAGGQDHVGGGGLQGGGGRTQSGSGELPRYRGEGWGGAQGDDRVQCPGH